MKSSTPVVVGLLFCLTLGLTVSPVLAATKTYDVTQHNMTFTSPFGPATICGVNGNFTVVFHLEEFHFVIWSDNHFTLSSMSHVSAYDDSGRLVAFEQAGNATLTGTHPLPLTSQGTGVGICTGATPMPGASFVYHQGFTIGKDGQIVEMHLVGNCTAIFCNIL